MLGSDRHRIAGATNDTGLRVRKRRPTLYDLDLHALEQGADAAIELVDDRFLPLNGFGQIEDRRLAKANSERAGACRVLHCLELASDVNQRFGRNAAAYKACPAETLVFHDSCVEAELPGTDSGHIATGSAADDKNMRL